MQNKNPQNNKKGGHDAWPKKELLLFEPRTLLVIIVSSVLTLLVAFFGEHGIKFMTSVLSPVPPHAPFDGFTMPVKQVPNWVKLTEAERKAVASAIPPDKFISLPAYNPTRLAIPTNSLKFNDPADDAIRNEKITFSTPWEGSYRLDGIEGSGSHPGVDIKIPEGTPIYAIANCTIIKADTGSGGFGKHVVCQHNDFPSFDDSSKKVTYFSAYAHLSSVNVNVHDVVTKGELIGFSGITGTATTPHLHFQIDTADSAWHPYWPFTSSEIRSAGLSFFEAINAAFKQSNVTLNTINPMRYIQKYAGDQTIVVSSNAELTEALEAADQYKDTSFVIQTTGGVTFEEGLSIDVIVQVFDASGNLLNWPKFQDEVTLSLLNPTGVLSKEKLTQSDLQTGIAKNIQVKETKVGRNKILLRFRDREFSSPELEVTAQKTQLQGFILASAKNEAHINDTVAVVIKAVDGSGATILGPLIFEESPGLGQTNQLGDLNINSLTPLNFSNGEALITFTPLRVGATEVTLSYKGQIFRSQTIVITENVEAAETGSSTPPQLVVPDPVVTEDVGTSTVSEPPTPGPFTDVASDSPYAEALTELRALGLVAGYADGSFKPDQIVTRAEAITFILRAIDKEARDEFQKLFPDVESDAWYAKFITTAYNLGFVKGYPDGSFRPQEQVNLAEFLTMLFVAAKTDVDPAITITMPEGSDPSAWYAPFVQVAIKKNIVEVKEYKLDASAPLTRGEIAKMLYRLRKLEKEALE